MEEREISRGERWKRDGREGDKQRRERNEK